MPATAIEIQELEEKAKSYGVTYTIIKDISFSEAFYTGKIFINEAEVFAAPGNNTAWEALDKVMEHMQAMVSTLETLK